DADPRISCRDAWSSPHLGHRSCEQDTGCGGHHVHARANYDSGSIHVGENVLRVLSNTGGPVSYSNLGQPCCDFDLCSTANLPHRWRTYCLILISAIFLSWCHNSMSW